MQKGCAEGAHHSKIPSGPFRATGRGQVFVVEDVARLHTSARSRGGVLSRVNMRVTLRS